MKRKTLMLSLTATLATATLSTHAAFAQFPPPPPMGGPPPIAAGGPPPMAAGGPPAFRGPPIRPNGAPPAGLGSPAPRLGAGAVPRGDLRALGSVRAGGRGAPAVATSARSASVI